MSLPVIVLAREERFKAMKRLFEVLESYVNEVISRPEEVDNIVDRLLHDERIIQLMLDTTKEILEAYRESPEKTLPAIVSGTEAIKEKLLRHGIDLTEEIEMLIEHDVFMIKLRSEKPDEFHRIVKTFKDKYPDDLKEHVHAYLASVLLLCAIDKTSDLNRLRRLAEQLRKYAEILDTYVTTFELMLEQETDTGIHSTHKTLETLREVLHSE